MFKSISSPKLQRLNRTKASKEEEIDATIRTQYSDESSQSSNSTVDGICNGTRRRLKSCMIVKTQQESSNERCHNDALSNARQRRAKRKPPSVEELRVNFSSVQIRVHRVQLGDNPSVKSGPALTVSWDHCPHFGTRILPIDEYDTARHSSRRSLSELVIPRRERSRLVRSSGHSKAEIRKSVKTTNIIRQRRKLRNSSSSSNMVELYDMISQQKAKVKRKLKNAFGSDREGKDFTAFVSSSEYLPTSDIKGDDDKSLSYLENNVNDNDSNDCNESFLFLDTNEDKEHHIINDEVESFLHLNTDLDDDIYNINDCSESSLSLKTVDSISCLYFDNTAATQTQDQLSDNKNNCVENDQINSSRKIHDETVDYLAETTLLPSNTATIGNYYLFAKGFWFCFFLLLIIIENKKMVELSLIY